MGDKALLWIVLNKTRDFLKRRGWRDPEDGYCKYCGGGSIRAMMDLRAGSAPWDSTDPITAETHLRGDCWEGRGR